MFLRWPGLAVIACFGLMAPAHADTLSLEKPAPYERCGYCHEYGDNPSMKEYPKLNGQKRQYLLKQLQDYKTGRRNGKGMMQTPVLLLSDEEMDVVADYYSKQKPVPENPPSTMKNAAHAREIWTKGIRARQIVACKLCHESSEPEIPRLAGQHAEYLASQLRAFKTRSRTNDVATIMQFLAERLSNDEILQLSHYLAAGAR